MTSPLRYVTEGIRHFRNSLHLKKNGLKRYPGTAKEISAKILRDCWNGRFFQTSTTNFPQFWTRDFGMCTESLMKLGYKKEVEQTLRYALKRFSKYNRVTTTISPTGTPFNIFTSAVDSLPWLMRSLTILNNKQLIKDFHSFLESQTNEYIQKFVGKDGLVKQQQYSSIKDFAIRKSSCYDNCMLGMLQLSLAELKLDNPLERFDYEFLIRHHFWNGNYFCDDLTKQRYVAADANIFPFYCKIINDKKIMKRAFAFIHVYQLDEPFPLKYTQKSAPVTFVWQEQFMKNYERDSIWMHIGPIYLKLLKTIDKKRADMYITRYTKMIEHFGTYPEVLTAKGKPFTAPFYHCDQGMLWCANYLTL